jgi:hypothetical protein
MMDRPAVNHVCEIEAINEYYEIVNAWEPLKEGGGGSVSKAKYIG